MPSPYSRRGAASKLLRCPVLQVQAKPVPSRIFTLQLLSTALASTCFFVRGQDVFAASIQVNAPEPGVPLGIGRYFINHWGTRHDAVEVVRKPLCRLQRLTPAARTV